MNKIKVMVVDDHPTFRDGLSKLLSDEPDIEAVASLADGEQAVELVQQLKPNVIVMDISMPKLNGMEAAKLIIDNLPDTAILMVSAFNYPSYVLAALKCGASGYLPKDTPMSEMLKAIRSISSGEAVFNMNVVGNILRRLASDKVEHVKEPGELHTRELQILKLAAKGLGNKKIASDLNISERTVQTHMVNIFRKLEVNSRTAAVLQGLKKGWITLDDLSGHTETENYF